jgi:pimeloyl-ACP methyl ester carboxylesterase
MVPDAAGPPESPPVVVLLHAGVADSRMWDAQRRALEDRYAVLAPDLRGFGERPHEPGPFSHTDDVLALLDAHGVEKAALVGASFGGRVALETASVAPDRVSALVLLSAAAPLLSPTPEVEGFDEEEERLLEAGECDKAVELNVNTWLGPSADDSTRALVRDMQTRAFALDAAAEELSPTVQLARPELDLAALTMPSLVVSGHHDLLWFQQTAQHLARQLPHVELVNLEWAGHLPSLERPRETASLVAAFLDGVL